MKRPTKTKRKASSRKPVPSLRTSRASASQSSRPAVSATARASASVAPRPRAVIILAAGQGTRMKSDLPKVLHPVAGVPMVQHVLAGARDLGAERTIVVVAPGMESVAKAVKPAATAVQKKQLGTGDAVKAAREALAGFDGDVVVLFGDTPLLRPATIESVLNALADAPRKRKGLPRTGEVAVAVLGFRPEGANEYGRLVTKPGGMLERIVEFCDASAKERAIPLCNSGVMAVRGRYLFDLLDGIKANNTKGEYYLTDIVALARKRGLRARVVEGAAEELLGVNSRADLAVAEAVTQQRLRAAVLANGATLTDPSTVYFSADTKIGRDVMIGPNVFFGPGVTVGDGVTIRSFCHMEGATIGANCIIGPFARLRPGAELGADVHVGNFCEIKAARLEDGAKVNHLSYIGDSRIGRGTNIGAGTITCNYDGYDKHRTDIGAGVFVGSDVAFVAPVTIGDGAVIGAGSVITRNVPDNAMAITRAEERQVADGGARYRARKQASKQSKKG